MLETIDIQGSGFNVLKDYNSWRIATLGYDKNSNSKEGIKGLGRHLETIEVFILIEGNAYMITAGYDSEPSKATIEKLEQGKLFVVQEKQWHGAVLEPGSRLLIIENRNTSSINSENYVMSSEYKKQLNMT